MGLLRMAARTAVVAGTATAVSGRVANKQQQKYANQAAEQEAQQQAAAPPPPRRQQLLQRMTRWHSCRSSRSCTARAS